MQSIDDYPDNNDIVIEVNNLSKMHRVYSKPFDILKEAFVRKVYHREFWVLRDLNFSIKKGEVVGILGRNGAGKSTLLKILTGTLEKTSGSVTVRGRVASILELGTGFHPEYSGRENIVMGGLCLGMSKKEIEAKMDSIIEFSELEAFIDQPFKTYSSGMQARLTFSTALSVEPDIFIVDEALSVGDILFQEKSMRRMREICEGGTTVLFVTHSLQSVYELCTRCFLLSDTKLVADGPPREVGEAYERLLAAAKRNSSFSTTLLQSESLTGSSINTLPTEPCDRVEGKEDSLLNNNNEYYQLVQIALERDLDVDADAPAAIIGFVVADSNRNAVTDLHFGCTYSVMVLVQFNTDIAELNVGFQFQKETGIPVIGDTTYEKDIHVAGKKGEIRSIVFEFECRVSAGTYLLALGLTIIRGYGEYELCELRRGSLVMNVMGKPINALVDPNSKINVFSFIGR